MSELRKFIEAQEHLDIPAEEVLNALQCIGFQASLRGLKPGLKAAKALKEPFLEFGNLIPQAGHLLEEFLRAGDLEPFLLSHEIGRKLIQQTLLIRSVSYADPW